MDLDENIPPEQLFAEIHRLNALIVEKIAEVESLQRQANHYIALAQKHTRVVIPIAGFRRAATSTTNPTWAVRRVPAC